ncbi:MAG: patatin-like phospholipase family protein [Pseudomonadota bacterium]
MRDSVNGKVAGLGDVAIFSGMTTAELERLGAAGTTLTLKKGETLIHQGEPSDALYIVLRGRFSVINNGAVIAEIAEGEPIGELGFFTGSPRTADVVAARTGKVLQLSREQYEAISKDMPQVSQSILAALSQRLTKATATSAKLRPQAARVAMVVPHGDAPLTQTFADQIAAAFGAHAQWSIVASDDVPKGDVEAVSDWLQTREAEAGNLLLLCAEPEKNNAWFEAAFENSDTVVVVAPPEWMDAENPTLSAREQRIFSGSKDLDVHLALPRPNKSNAISGTGAWLSERPVRLHHHLALDDAASFERMARFVRGEALGLVMSGGGAFGTAHLGAIKALQERGFVFDMVGGTSIGCAMAAVLAMEMAPSDAMDICEDMFLKSKAMGRFTVPLYSVLDHRQLDLQLKKHYGERRVEDLPVNYFAVATNLSTNDLHLMRDGPVWQTVRASASLPGVFPPVVTEHGDVLIDGGLLDNIPITPMRELKAGPNVIFSFDHIKPWKVKAPYSALPGRLGALARMLKLKKVSKPRFPTVFSVLARSMVVSARRLMEATDISGDVMIELQTVRGMGFLDWRKGRSQFDVAYRQMSDLLDDLRIDDGNSEAAEKLARIAAHMSGKNQAGDAA